MTGNISNDVICSQQDGGGTNYSTGCSFGLAWKIDYSDEMSLSSESDKPSMVIEFMQANELFIKYTERWTTLSTEIQTCKMIIAS